MLFAIPAGEHLSSQDKIDPLRAVLVPGIGGSLLGGAFLLLLRWRPAREVDPIEANALHGGRMSFRGSVIVALQTIWSSGVGASVGLEAGYTQLASGLGASIGRGFHLRRADQRIMVGCGAAAAIAGAFGAPLAGAFYAFELVIGGYTPASLTPVGVAAVIGYLVAQASAAVARRRHGSVRRVSPRSCDRSAARACSRRWSASASCAASLVRDVLTIIRISPPVRLAAGGSRGPAGAADAPGDVVGTWRAVISRACDDAGGMIAAVFVLKSLASIVSLGSGFRGGLFFATLLSARSADVCSPRIRAVWPGLDLDPNIYAMIGMSALSASVIGGPLTMSFIALEFTGNLWLTSAVLVAVMISTLITRELFGYSFATWRMHLRGETIRSAADVGWISAISR